MEWDETVQRSSNFEIKLENNIKVKARAESKLKTVFYDAVNQRMFNSVIRRIVYVLAMFLCNVLDYPYT